MGHSLQCLLSPADWDVGWGQSGEDAALCHWDPPPHLQVCTLWGELTQQWEPRTLQHPARDAGEQQ